MRLSKETFNRLLGAALALALAACGTIESSEFQPVAPNADTPHAGRGILVENELEAFLADRVGSRDEILTQVQGEALQIEAWLLTDPLFEGLRDQVQSLRIRVLHYAGEYPEDAGPARQGIRDAVTELAAALKRAGRSVAP